MAIIQPPEVEPNPLSVIASDCPDRLNIYLELFSPTDKKGRYLHFDELRYRLDPSLDNQLAWSLVKSARNRQYIRVIELGVPAKVCNFILTPVIQKAISETDRNTTRASLEWISSKIGEKAQIDYLLNDLVEDESISSSQLEGSATTTSVAKELLKRNKKPKSADEKMIIANFKMMKFAWDNRSQPLSIDLIKNLHEVGVEGIDNQAYTPGYFRKTDDVYVADLEGNIIHSPPPAEGLKARIKNIVDWANKDHEELGDSSYLHPLIKAITLHFCIGYEHPFRDGNGRVARALFYWYLFRSDFAAFRYIAISVFLKKAPAKYGKSYLYTETDDMDLTYFLEYQSGIVIRAIEKFKESYQRAALEIEEFNKWLWDSGLYKKLTDKQRTVFQVAKSGHAVAFTIRNVEKNLGCSYNTAASVLNGLVDMNLFRKVKNGREWLYFVKDKSQITNSWGS